MGRAGTNVPCIAESVRIGHRGRRKSARRVMLNRGRLSILYNCVVDGRERSL